MEPLDPDDEVTLLRPVRPAAPEPDDDPEADTVIRERQPLVDLRSPGPAVAQPAPIDPVGVDALLIHFFSVNHNEPIGLDRPALIGRKPSLPRIPRSDRPRLVRVPSPLGEVSATHLELRQEGSTIVVTDLRSTNGTLVLVRGRAPLTLRPGESVVVLAGTVVDIGDGNIVEILPVRAGATGSPSTDFATTDSPSTERYES